MHRIAAILLMPLLLGLCTAQAQDTLPVTLPMAQAPDSTGDEGPVVCKVGMYIKTLRVLEADELFEVLFYWWLRVDSVGPDADVRHVGEIEFINADAAMEVDYDSLDLATRSYLVMGHCKASIPYKADFHRFPYDVQSMVVALENKVYNTGDVIYVPDDRTQPLNAVEHNNVEILNGTQFIIRSLEARTTTHTYETNFGDLSVEGFEPYSRMEFVIGVDRDPWGLMEKMALPLFVVLFLSYLVFFIPDFEIGTASALTVTALLAAIAFQWTLSESLPNVTYMTVVDELFYLVYIYIFYAMAQTVFTFNLSKKGEQMMDRDPKRAQAIQDLSERIEWHSRYLFPLTFALFTWLLIR